MVKEKGLSVTEFGKRINTHRRNVYDIFKRESVDTELLQKISKVLEHDFFKYYNQGDNNELLVIGDNLANYKKTEKINSEHNQLIEKLAGCEKEIEYLKDLIKEKDKVIALLEMKKK
ncbi:MAG: hypothetical protein ABIJ97_10685 [Bacteroidota bacterium]